MAERNRRVGLTLARGESYTINTVANPSGTTFTNASEGGSVVAYVLPKAGPGRLGETYRFRSVVNQPLAIGVQEGDRLMTLGNENASQVLLTTVGAQIEVEVIRLPSGGYCWFAAGGGGGAALVADEITVNGIRCKPAIERVNNLTQLAWKFFVGSDWETQSSRAKK